MNEFLQIYWKDGNMIIHVDRFFSHNKALSLKFSRAKREITIYEFHVVVSRRLALVFVRKRKKTVKRIVSITFDNSAS